MIIPTLIKLGEGEKRVIIALCILILVLIVILGYLTSLVQAIMRRQGKAVDKYMYQIAQANFLPEKEFTAVARQKSNIYFFQKSWLGIAVIFFFGTCVLIYGWSIGDFSYISTAFENLSFTLDWPMTQIFGMNIVSDWPTVIKQPDLSWEIGKYLTYFFFIGLTLGAIMFLVNVQALIARAYRISHFKRDYFSKDLNNLKGQQAPGTINN